ncbi:MAG TPA: NifB/NifX family molybdenum-iron cluster-binding protein [Bryobacteraceae bacterium]|nr:NifB/NifX family molybdenum-iron cluster-binding protein [Bryobacteraceae bacterium]
MKLAIGTADGAAVCDHLARSSSFVVLDIAEGRIAGRTVRERATGACGNHQSFVEILAGCDAVICGGIGEGAARSLAQAGIRSVVASGPHTIDEAAALFLQGKLATTTERVCLCHSH